MRVLQLGKFFPVRGGVEKVMRDLTAALGNGGVDCDMVCATLGPSEIVQLSPRSRAVCLHAVAKKAATMICPAMVSYMRRHSKGYDIVHIHHPDPMAAVALLFSGYKGKVVLHWHSDILKQKILLEFFKPLQSWLLRRADVIVTTSPAYLSGSASLQPHIRKCRSIPIGVDELAPDAVMVEKLRSECSARHIVFALGRFVEYKGFEFLVDAASLLPEDYRVVIAGDGPLRSELMRKAEAGGLNVLFPGMLTNEERAAWFGACDVYVMSSVFKTEAFGIVQIEAMSCAKPVVATDIPQSGVPWVNEDGVSGLNVPVCNPEALAGAIMEICGSAGRHSAFSAAARKRYEELFTLDHMVSECVKMYETL